MKSIKSNTDLDDKEVTNNAKLEESKKITTISVATILHFVSF